MHDAEQPVVGVDDREPGDAVLAADLVELLERRVRADRDRVGDDPGLGPLDQVDLVGLVLDRQVAVQHAEAALAGHRDRHPRLGDGVHRGADQRHPERDPAGQPGGGVDVGGREVGLAGQQQDVVVGQAERGELVGDSGSRSWGPLQVWVGGTTILPAPPVRLRRARPRAARAARCGRARTARRQRPLRRSATAGASAHTQCGSFSGANDAITVSIASQTTDRDGRPPRRPPVTRHPQGPAGSDRQPDRHQAHQEQDHAEEEERTLERALVQPAGEADGRWP